MAAKKARSERRKERKERIDKRRKAREDAKVEIFGEEIKDTKHYEDTGGVVWGVLLIFGGILFLLNTLNLVPWEVWGQLWQFWPVLLILVGFRIILGNNAFSRLLVTALSIFVIGMAFAIALSRTSPELVANFPQEIKQLINTWEGVIK